MNLISLLIAASVFQGLLLIIVTLSSKKRGFWLICFFIAITIFQLGRLLLNIYPTSITCNKLAFLSDLMIFLVTPFQYVYLRSLVDKQVKITYRIIYHFIPACIHLITLIPYLIVRKEEFYTLLEQSNTYFLVIESFGIIFNIIYFILIWKMLKKIKLLREEQYSFFNNPIFIRSMLLIAPVLAIWLLSFSLSHLIPTFSYSFLTYQFVWAIMSFIVFGFSYFALKNPLWFSPIVEEDKIIEVKNLSNTKIADEKKYQELLRFVSEGKLFLDQELTVSKLAAEFKISSHELSRIINIESGSNFFEFVNKFRIEEFKKLASKSNIKQFTILSLAFQAGFNSKSTFNEAFKRICGITPTEYLKEKLSPDL